MGTALIALLLALGASLNLSQDNAARKLVDAAHGPSTGRGTPPGTPAAPR